MCSYAVVVGLASLGPNRDPFSTRKFMFGATLSLLACVMSVSDYVGLWSLTKNSIRLKTKMPYVDFTLQRHSLCVLESLFGMGEVQGAATPSSLAD